jgi:hypothetical protein
MDDNETPVRTTKLFPPYLLWFVLIPALPFVFSAASLSFFVTPAEVPHAPVERTAAAKLPTTKDGKQFDNDSKQIFVRKLLDIKIDYIDPPLKTLTHLSNLFTYLSITAVHGIVCLFVIGFLLYQIHKLPGVLIKRTYLYMAFISIAFLIMAYVVRSYGNSLILTQLGYKSICILLSKAELQTALVWADLDGGHTGEACFLSRNTRLVWLAYTPIAFGMLAIVVATAFTTVLASQSIPGGDKQWRLHFLSRIKILQKCFYLLSLVLVTSTITILYFTSLPLDLLADAQLKNALGKFFNGLTAFWGGLFSATLFATFAPAVVLFIKHARHHQTEPTPPSDLGQWLNETIFVSFKKQAMNVLVIIAPMLVGPFSELLKNLSMLSG